MKKKRKAKQIFGSCQRAEKAVEHKSDGDTICSWCTWNGTLGSGKEAEKIEDQKKNRDYPGPHTVKISRDI